jgi:regulator of protease activity HflC (stomatin/prohibitin superfamily)
LAGNWYIDISVNKEKIGMNVFKKKNLILIVIVYFLLSGIAGKALSSILTVAFFAYVILYILNTNNKLNLNKLNLNIFKINKNKSMDTIDVNKQEDIKKVKKFLGLGLVAIIVIWLFFSSIIIVEAGQTGVYHLFGKVRDNEVSSGFHLINPLAKVTTMSIRTQDYTMSFVGDEGNKKGVDSISALTKEGLQVDLDITVLYRLEESKASDIYREVGLNYEEKIIRPVIRSTIREVIATYNSKDIYSEKREQATVSIFEDLNNLLSDRGIITEEVLLRNVKLPNNLANSIQEKLQAEQESQKYEFILQKEKKEKERKLIEAEGQRDAQAIINQSLTPNYLYYLYIKELKDREGTIYVPVSPESGMPMFKGIE